MPTPSRPTSRTWARIQAASGLVLTLFVGLHLANLFAANFGPATYDRVQRWFRPIYQFPAFELLAIVLAIAIHVTAGIVRIRERRRGDTPRPHLALGLRLHRWSAYFLLTFVLGHALATRLPSLLFGAWPESGGVGFTLWWLPGIFYPYYALLAFAGLYHGVYGIRHALGTLGLARLPAPSPPIARLAMAIGLVAIVGALLALGGITHAIPDPTDNDFARVYERYFGVDLDR